MEIANTEYGPNMEPLRSIFSFEVTWSKHTDQSGTYFVAKLAGALSSKTHQGISRHSHERALAHALRSLVNDYESRHR